MAKPEEKKQPKRGTLNTMKAAEIKPAKEKEPDK